MAVSSNLKEDFEVVIDLRLKGDKKPFHYYNLPEGHFLRSQASDWLVRNGWRKVEANFFVRREGSFHYEARLVRSEEVIRKRVHPWEGLPRS